MKKVVLVVAVTLLGCLTSCKKEEVKTNQNTPTIPNYTNFKITSIQVNNMPMVNSDGASWDLFDGPDVKFNIEDYYEQILYNGSTKFDDLTSSSLPIKWELITSYPVTNFDLNYFISLYDYDDFDSNDKIGYVGINFNQHKSGYPTSITKVSADGSISITINGSWY